MRKALSILFILIFTNSGLWAQTNDSEIKPRSTYKGIWHQRTYIANEKNDSAAGFNLWEWMKCYDIANNLDVAFTFGTPGFGLEVATPVTRWARLRAGVEWMPKIHVPMTFDINTFSDGLPNGNFYHVQEMLYNLTGIEMDDEVKMIGKPNLINFKLLVDVFPFQNNRHWHFTAGFYVGNREVATAINDKKEMPTLVGLNIYNRMYNYFTNITDIFDVPLGGGNYMDPDEVEKMQERFRRYGRMGMHVGDFKDGTPYIMEPSPDGSLRAKAFVNKFKPYLGFGYSGAIDAEKRWNVGFEAGVLFWGGAADVYNYDYREDREINMTKDLVNIGGKVGTYIDFIKALPVYPAISFKISYTFF